MKHGLITFAFLAALVSHPLMGQDWCSSRTHYSFGCPTFIGNADLDGDGDTDLFVTSCCSAEFSLTTLFNDGAGAFPSVVTNSFGSGGTGGPGACMLDIDLDGDLDIVVPNHFNYCLKILINDGEGVFSQTGCIATTLPSGQDSPFEVASADFNDDGYPDVAAVSRTSDKLIIYLNDGAGTLAVAALISTADEPFFIQSADVNNDTKVDLVVSIAAQGLLSVFLGNGDGTFQSPISTSVGPRPYYFSLADLDEDGFVDVTISYNTLGSWSLCLGHGDGTFDGPTYYGSNIGFSHWTGDVDADGDVDVATAESGLDSMHVWTNDGYGVFSNTASCFVGDQPFSVTMADFNSDGRSDVAVANYGVTDPAGVAVFLSPDLGSPCAIEGTASSGSTKLLGIPVDLYDTEGNMLASTATNAVGNYQFTGLDRGFYFVAISTPLGYSSSEETKVADLSNCLQVVDFNLTKLNSIPNPRPRAYWANQIQRAMIGRPQDISLGRFALYCGEINQHFNSNRVNPITEFTVAQPASRVDSLSTLRGLLFMSAVSNNDQPLRSIARAQLVTLLLNVVSGKISQAQTISQDGRSVSQLLTYCDALINDESDPPMGSNLPGYGSPWYRYLYATFLLTETNFGVPIPQNTIPENVAQISYKMEDAASLPVAFELSQNQPNPFNPSTVISFSLPNAASVKLAVYNVAGQEVAVLVDEMRPAGTYSVTWDGRVKQGTTAASGVYLYRLEANNLSASRKMLLLK